jgi:peptide/nickel transport system substrate-binding protein
VYPLKLNRKYLSVFGITTVLCLLVGVIYFFAQESEVADDGQLIIGRYNDAISLDPAITTDSESFEVASNIYETLVKTDKNAQVLLPGLAESWKMSEDGLTWTFKIRKNVSFHDGSRLDAKAVAFNFHRWMNENSPYHTGQFTYWSHSFNGFPGIVGSVTALSDSTLEIVLNEPFAPFLNVLSMPAFSIASPEAIMTYNEGLKDHPIGTGPFKFKLWEKGEKVIIERNNDYWDEGAKLSQVVYRVIKPYENRMTLLESGDIHIANNLLPLELAAVETSPALNIQYRPFLNIGYLALNNQSEYFSDPRVREVINLLIDKNKMLENELDALTRPAHSFLPPLLLGYHEGLQSPDYDIEKARVLLGQAGYKDGFETTLWVMDKPRNYFSNPRRMASYIKEQLAPVGINVTIEVFEWEAYLEAIKEGDHQMALVGWNGDFVDPDNFLYTLFSSENMREGLVLNYSFYENKEVDYLLTQARRSTDTTFRKSLYREIQEIIDGEVASIPLVHTMTASAVSKSVEGFNVHIAGSEDLKDVKLIDGE